MDVFDSSDFVGAAFGGAALIWQTLDKIFKGTPATQAVIEGAQQRMPGAFASLTLDDEQIYVGIISFLETNERKAISALMKELGEKWKTATFRKVVAGMPAGKKVEKKISTNKKGERSEEPKEVSLDGTADDRRVHYLKAIAKQVEEDGAEAVANELQNMGFVARNPFTEQFVRAFSETGLIVREVKRFFGVNDLEDITLLVVSQKIEGLRDSIPKNHGLIRVVADRNQAPDNRTRKQRFVQGLAFPFLIIGIIFAIAIGSLFA